MAELEVAGEAFVMGGRPFDLWGIRVASAAVSDAGCAALLASLDDYLAYGINTIAVFLQGSGGGSIRAFSEDGARLDPGVQRRIAAFAVFDVLFVHHALGDFGLNLGLWLLGAGGRR